MAFVSEADKQRIETAISRAEARTRGEFVTIVAQVADDYLYISVLWAALLALVVPGAAAFIPWPSLHAHTYAAQILVFLIAAVALRWRPLMMLTIPRSLKRRRAQRLAREQFFAHNLHHTREGTGVLLFVSVAERYVEIIADRGICDAVDEKVWQEIVAVFVECVRDGRVADGFVEAIGRCGDQLATHFPIRDGDENELTDHLIEI